MKDESEASEEARGETPPTSPPPPQQPQAPSSGSGDGNGESGGDSAGGGNAAAATAVPGWRVKLYQLEPEGAWLDKGTGCASCRVMEGGPKIFVTTEDGTGVVLDSKIRSDDIYERQGESIIMWREPGVEIFSDTDYALSFQDSAGCVALWESIIAVQRQYLLQQEYGQVPSFGLAFSRSRSDGGGATSPSAAQSISGLHVAPSIPPLSASTVGEVREKFVSMHVSQKDAFAGLVLAKEGEFIDSLLTLSSDLEDLEDNENLKKIADICRSLMLLNEPSILEILVSENKFLGIAGIMEYDPALKSKHDFRAYLSGGVKRKDVPGAELTDAGQIASIEKLFRLRFLRDSLARPALEESGSGAIDSAINSATFDMCTRLLTDLPLMIKLFLIICPTLEVPPLTPPANSTAAAASAAAAAAAAPVDAAESPTPPKGDNTQASAAAAAARLDALTFLRQLFHTTRSLSFDRRFDLYNRFCLGEGFGQAAGLRKPFFSICLDVLANPNSTSIECSLMTECLVCLATVCPNHLRLTVLQGPVPTFPQFNAGPRPQGAPKDKSVLQPLQQNNKSLLWVLIHRLLMDSDHALLDNLGEIVRVLIDPDRFDRQEKDNFLGLFYDHYVYWLMVPFAEEFAPDKELPRDVLIPQCCQMKQSPSAVANSRRVLVDLLCLCVGGHSYRMKYFVMRNGAISLILRLMKSTRRYLQLSAIKFLRTIVASKDEFYFRHLVKLDLLSPIVDILKQGKDGIVTSAVLELIDYICREGIKTLVGYLVEKHSDCFVGPICTELSEKLKWVKDQARGAELGLAGKGVGSGGNGAGSSLASVALRQKRQQEQDRDSEDEYFFDDDVFSFDAAPPSSDANALSYIAATYAQDEVGDDLEKTVYSLMGDTAEVESKESQPQPPPLPPLRPKFEFDDGPDTLVRVRTKESDLTRLSSNDQFDSDGGEVGGDGSAVLASSSSSSAAAAAIGNGGAISVPSGISFSLKRRVRSLYFTTLSPHFQHLAIVSDSLIR